MRKVEVLPYNPLWVSKFEEEAENFRLIFGKEIIVIHHIGSTAVPGLNAKPIIDVMPVVKDINRVDEYNGQLLLQGYESKGENGICGRRYFTKGGNHRTHHIHIYALGNPQIERHLAFRDYLRAHPKTAKNYGDLKAELAVQYPYDISSYIKGKEELGLEIDRLAAEWAKNS
ncbi:GrpB family protein [Paenibacillus thermotolerans]|uniref:GrpB family protein n=1 Tax=Paenibacillus thermotolerans TaxID=3027807 RepID=UPI00236874FD|nr:MULTISPECIES: GrpB family protein [unclassified Paenibacillus]